MMNHFSDMSWVCHFHLLQCMSSCNSTGFSETNKMKLREAWADAILFVGKPCRMFPSETVLLLQHVSHVYLHTAILTASASVKWRGTPWTSKFLSIQEHWHGFFMKVSTHVHFNVPSNFFSTQPGSHPYVQFSYSRQVPSSFWQVSLYLMYHPVAGNSIIGKCQFPP